MCLFVKLFLGVFLWTACPWFFGSCHVKMATRGGRTNWSSTRKNTSSATAATSSTVRRTRPRLESFSVTINRSRTNMFWGQCSGSVLRTKTCWFLSYHCQFCAKKNQIFLRSISCILSSRREMCDIKNNPFVFQVYCSHMIYIKARNLI